MSDQHQRRIDRVLDPAYLADLGARSDDDVREMRRECREMETEYSYLRRLAQARTEILEAEQRRREQGAPLSDLIEALPSILADKAPTAPADPAQVRIPSLLVPKKLDGYSRGLERLVEDDTLANLPMLSDDELEESLAQLRILEREVSGIRRDLHAAIDTLATELAERSRTA